MKKTKFWRKNTVIFDDKQKIIFNGKGNTNPAKRESRRLQIAEDGALGRGSVQVIK